MNRTPRHAAALLTLALGATACFTAPPAPPTAPAEFTATSTQGAIELAWSDPNTDETGSRVYRAEGDAELQELDAIATVVDGNHRSAVDGDVHVGVQYRYGVAAEGTGGTSALAETPEPVGPLPLDEAVTGRLSVYAPAYGGYALASMGVLQIADPGGGPSSVSFGDEVQLGTVDAAGVLDIALQPLADGALRTEDFCGTELRTAYLFTLTVATVPQPESSSEIGAFAGLTNTGGRDPVAEAEVGDAVGAWLYVPEAAAVDASCTAADETLWTYDLDLDAGWNAVLLRTDAAAGGVPTERTLTSSTSGDLVWVTRPTAVEGVLLEGAPGSLAIDAAYDLSVPLPATAASEIEFDEELDNDVLRTEIDVEFAADATVEQVNALLEAYGARIVSMVRNTTIFVVRVPDPGSIAALHALIGELEALEEVRSVLQSIVVEPDADPRPNALPGGLDPTDTAGDIRRVDHHLAVRAHGAWNVAHLMPDEADRPWLVIGDWFGDGAPDDGTAAVVEDGDYGTGNGDDHGYHVLGIATGAHGAGASSDDRDDVTGVVPAALNVRAADFADTTTSNRGRNLLMQRINEVVDEVPEARIVVNTSLGYRSDPGTAAANLDARAWVTMVRANDHEDRMLHLTSAGNGGSTAVVQRNSLYTFAALGAMTAADGGGIANLTNTLVIENRTNTLTNGLDRPAPGCASVGSTMGGHLSAIGTNVWSFGSGNTAAGASNQSGTSMATPQVAGLAAYVWSFDPALSPQQVAAVLTDAARAMAGATTNVNGTCNTVAAQPVIDALDALVAVAGDRARKALLDVGGGPLEILDHFDLALFLAGLPDAPTLDYGRSDLNGDGVSDPDHVSTLTERLDLDGDGTYGIVEQTIAGQTVAFDETALTDIEVACYLAWSPLYDRGALQRNALLGGELLVRIAGPRQRYVPVESDGAGGLTIDDLLLTGGVTAPRCTSSIVVDQAGLEWLDEGSAQIGSGSQYTLTDADLRIGALDAFVARTLTLRYEAGPGAVAQSQVTVIPCARASDALEGYPECPILIGDLVESLGGAFGTFPTDVAAEVARAIHGIPEYRSVLDALGLEPCDPRFCDPFPPGFPDAQIDLRAGWYGDRGETTAMYLDELFEMLASPSLDAFDADLDAWLRAVSAEGALPDGDRELIGAAAAVALAGVEFFAPASAGGAEAWQAFTFAQDPEGLVQWVDVLAPARRGLEGFLTSVVFRNARSGFATELDLNAAAYAMSLEALAQASAAAQEGF
ncbi:MAG: S8 family serine peptidase [Trueperaceae bacterium]